MNREYSVVIENSQTSEWSVEGAMSEQASYKMMKKEAVITNSSSDKGICCQNKYTKIMHTYVLAYELISVHLKMFMVGN